MSIKKVIIKNGKYELTSDEPKYGINYGKGYIGFCYDLNSKISKGIAFATRFCRYTGIKVSHALIVIDENLCIEADAAEKKVIVSPLKKYFDNENRIISFRKPKDLTLIAASQIAEAAKSKIGCGYEFLEIAGHVYKAMPLIKQFHKLTNNFFVDMISNKLDNPDKFICSELAAYCLKSATDWQYHNKGILKRKTQRLNPQELFEDRIIFEDWKFEETKTFVKN